MISRNTCFGCKHLIMIQRLICRCLWPPGGSTLYIESAIRQWLDAGKEGDKPQGSMELTGHLGEVMKESANIAYTVARSVLHREKPDNTFLSCRRIHVHVPEASLARHGWVFSISLLLLSL